jgi:hypothetical protein
MSVEDAYLVEDFTGVFEGVLLEDALVTYKRVGLPYINVLIKAVHGDNPQSYPLTYVPVGIGHDSVIPLRKDQTVKVRFLNNNVNYPVLWKTFSDPVEVEFPEKPEYGDLVEFEDFPEEDEYLSFMRIFPDVLVYFSDSQVILVKGESIFHLSSDNVSLKIKDLRFLLDTFLFEITDSFKSQVESLEAKVKTLESEIENLTVKVSEKTTFESDSVEAKVSQKLVAEFGEADLEFKQGLLKLSFPGNLVVSFGNQAVKIDLNATSVKVEGSQVKVSSGSGSVTIDSTGVKVSGSLIQLG